MIASIRHACLGAVLAMAINSSAEAGVITRFEDALQPNTPAPGWSYLWNLNGEVGNAMGYVSLLPTPNSSYFYDADGLDGLEGAGFPAGATYIGVTDSSRPIPGLPGGHPGQGFGQPGSLGIERFVIAAYTVSSAGRYRLIDSRVRNEDISQDGLRVVVHTNSSGGLLFDGGTLSGLGSETSFDLDFGTLAAGDTIYVGVGSRSNDLFDTYSMNFAVEHHAVPEPTSLGLCGAAMLVLGVTRLRRRRNSAS